MNKVFDVTCKYLYFFFGILLQEDKCNVVLEAYVKYLIEEDHKELVSFYVSKLPPAAQVHWYARFLEGKAAEC